MLKEIHGLEILQESVDLSEKEYLRWTSIKAQLESIYLEEEMYWKNKSKQQWLKEGNHSTKFFDVVASHRNKKNKINTLDINGIRTNNLGEMKKHVVEFYKQLLGGTKSSPCRFISRRLFL